MASLLGVPRHGVTARLAAYAAGGLDQALRSHGPLPPVPRRMTDPALTALREKLREPHGVAGDNQSRLWFAQEPQGDLAYSRGQALVRYQGAAPTIGILVKAYGAPPVTLALI